MSTTRALTVLYLVHRVPYAPNRGDRIRAYHTLRFMQRQGIAVYLMAFAHDRDEVQASSSLRDIVSHLEIIRLPRVRNYLRSLAALPGPVPLTHLLLDSGNVRSALARAVDRGAPDVVLAYCSGMARFALEPPLASLPFVLDMVDVDSFKWQALAATARPPLSAIYAREARRLATFEARAACRAHATLVVSDGEAEGLRAIAPGVEPLVIPNGVDTDYFRPPASRRTPGAVVFTGVFSYAPNAEGARWLLAHVWPLVRASAPHARLTLVGTGADASLRRAAAAAGGVTVTGTVPDVRPYLWNAAVSVAPIFTARGTQNKVLEAVAAGVSAVVTPLVSRGLPHPVRQQCRVAESAQQFATAICAAIAAPPSDGIAVDLPGLSWAESLSPLEAVLRRARDTPTKRA